TECYDLLAASGLDIHPGHRGIETVYVGDRQVLGRLSLPRKLAGDGEYVLHPSLLDSAVQTIAGLLRSADETNRALSIQTGIPFAVDKVEIFAACEPTMWAYLRPATGTAIQSFDLDMVDDAGRCCVRFHGLSMRSFEGPASKPAAVARVEAI